MTLLDIFNKHGYENQLLQLCEECSELVQALNKYRRYKDKATPEKLWAMRHDICEEIADVEIVIRQFESYLGIKEFAVMEEMDLKIERQIKREESEKYDNRR